MLLTFLPYNESLPAVERRLASTAAYDEYNSITKDFPPTADLDVRERDDFNATASSWLPVCERKVLG
jgi:hypothetical protein